MENCIFCKIVAGVIPSPRLYEDDQMIIIRDIQPKAKLHYLCMPKTHFSLLSEMDEAIYVKKKFLDEEEREAFRATMEQRERFARQKNEMEKLIDFLAGNKERQQEYMDKLDRMERRGVIEEEIVW